MEGAGCIEGKTNYSTGKTDKPYRKKSVSSVFSGNNLKKFRKKEK